MLLQLALAPTVAAPLVSSAYKVLQCVLTVAVTARAAQVATRIALVASARTGATICGQAAHRQLEWQHGLPWWQVQHLVRLDVNR
jgi:hypothetical protein